VTNSFSEYLEKARQIYRDVVEGVPADEYALACSEFNVWCSLARIEAAGQQVGEISGLEKTFREFQTKLSKNLTQLSEDIKLLNL